jgi:uncharacterized membrane protein
MLASAAVLWAASLPLAAYAANQPAGSPSSVFALAVYALGSVICHQRPERSFHLWSAQLPVCARCTGVYFGAAIGAVAAIVGAANDMGRPRSAPTRDGVRLALVAAAAPAALTLVYEWVTGVTPSNVLRTLTGIVLGVVAAWVVVRETLR